jgi:hypothetical protein
VKQATFSICMVLCDAGNAFPVNSIRITFAGTSDEIVVPYTLNGGTFSGELEQIVIAGGPTLNMFVPNP